MNKNRIWLFAGLGILATCVSILAAKKYIGKNKSGESGSGNKPRYRERIQ